ncbi:hypothetical protein EV180_007322, partial [Coemansia sp. RSA 518]
MLAQEQDGQSPPPANVPVLEVDRAAFIQAKAQAIFAKFKFDIGRMIPNFKDTCNVTEDHLASMEWTKENWQAVIKPI